MPGQTLAWLAPGDAVRPRALLAAVRTAAAAAGALRLPVQTEPDSTAALQLYRTSGFGTVDGTQLLMLPLQP